MDRNPSPEELRLAELHDQFLALSDDQDNAGRIIFRGPNGQYVGEVKLSARDVKRATIALTSLNAHWEQEEARLEAETLPLVDADAVDDVVAGFERLLGNGGE